MRNLFNFESYILRNRWALEWALRIWGGKKILANYFLSRSLSMGVPLSYTFSVFEKIRSLEDWVRLWYRLGVKCESMAKSAEKEGLSYTTTQFWLIARAVFHMAQFPFYEPSEYKQRIYFKSAAAYAKAAPQLDPPARKVFVPFQSFQLPGYFRETKDDQGRCVVILGGIDGVKEEIHYYGEYFVKRGFSVLYFDAPGLGESWSQVKLEPNFQELGESIHSFIQKSWPNRFSKISILGISLGGNMVIHMAASKVQFTSCAAISPPFAPRLYFNQLPFLVQKAAGYIVGGDSFLNDFMERISLREIISKVHCPLLVVGGGKDRIIPGQEAVEAFKRAPEPKRLLFYPDGTHVCPEYNVEMLWEIEKWFKKT